MNWSFLLANAVVIIGLSALCFVALYYVRYTHSKKQQVVVKHKFFSRYKPQQIEIGQFIAEPANDAQVDVASKPLQSFKLYMVTLAIPLTVLCIVLSSLYVNRHKALTKIDLTHNEKVQISTAPQTLEPVNQHYLDSLPQVLGRSSRPLVLISGGIDDRFNSVWSQFLTNYGAHHSRCDTNTIKACLSSGSAIIMANVNAIGWQKVTTLLEQGHNVIAHGFSNDELTTAQEMLGLRFQADGSAAPARLALVGDRELSLGLDASLHIPVPSTASNWHAVSERPQGIAMHSDRIAGGTIKTRLYAKAYKSSRFVWMDFLPNANANMSAGEADDFSAIMANIMRYANGERYQSLATWPQGKMLAALFEEDTEHGFEHAEKVAEFFLQNRLPITWYMLSNLAEQNRSLTEKLALTGEVACHGDNHDIFPRYTLKQQTHRLQRCVKVLETITGKKVRGFRPPTEAYNTDTLSALVNNGMQHIFARSTSNSGLPQLLKSQDGRTLVHIPRINSDDYQLWHTLQISTEESLQKMRNEVNWIEQTGSLFTFSFHTQFMSDDNHLNMVKTLAGELNRTDVYFSTANEISNWWQFRHQLLTDELSDTPLTQRMLQKYHPMQLRVNYRGELLKTPLHRLN